jgi:plastocyanin
MRRTLLLPLIAGALALASCGGDDEPSSTAPATTSGGSGSSPSGAVQVAMENIQFTPETVTVKVGQRITWTNEDGVQHDVESTSGEKVDSELFGEGGTFSFTPTKAGTIEYVCTVHPGMEGTIVVEE